MSKSYTSNISENPYFKQMVEKDKENTAQRIQIQEMTGQIIKLTAKIDSLTEKLSKSQEQIAQLLSQNVALCEQVKLMAHQKFGQKSEKRSSKKKDDDQDDSDESGSSSDGDGTTADPDEQSAERNAYRNRNRAKKARKPKISMEEMIAKNNLPTRDVYHELPEEERICSACGTELEEMGSHFLHYSLDITMPVITVVRHYAKTYHCAECKKRSTDSSTPLEELNRAPISASGPKQLLDGKWITAPFIAFLIVMKAEYQIPTNRIYNILQNLGCFSPTPATLCSWIIETSQKYLAPVFERMKQYLLARPILCADETTLQVINEAINRRKQHSYLWQYSTPETDPLQIVLFDYKPGRAGKYAAEFLRGFLGKLLVDGFSGYNKVKNVKLAHCWVHARRYFIEAAVATKNKEVIDQAETALDYFDKIFEIEREMDEKNLSYEERMERRYEKSTPIVEDLFKWVDAQAGKPHLTEKLKKAIGYLQNHREGLKVFLGDPLVPASNNLCERQFISVARGRNNWLFAYSEAGAHALAKMFSIVKTAIRNGLNATKYITYLLERLTPKSGAPFTAGDLDELLPWSEHIQSLPELKCVQA